MATTFQQDLKINVHADANAAQRELNQLRSVIRALNQEMRRMALGEGMEGLTPNQADIFRNKGAQMRAVHAMIGLRRNLGIQYDASRELKKSHARGEISDEAAKIGIAAIDEHIARLKAKLSKYANLYNEATLRIGQLQRIEQRERTREANRRREEAREARASRERQRAEARALREQNRVRRQLLRNIGRFGRDLDRAFTTPFRTTISLFRTIENEISRLIRIGGELMVLFAGIAGLEAFHQLIIRPTSLADSLRRTAIGIETVYKSVGKSSQDAAAVMEVIKDFSLRAPFDFQQLAEAAHSAFTFGFRDARQLRELFEAVGDFATLRNDPEAFPQLIDAIGRVMIQPTVRARQLSDLQTMGINAYRYIGQAMGIDEKRVEALARSQKLGLAGERAAEMILQGLRREFGGGIERVLNETMSGNIHRLKAIFDLYVLAPIGETINQVMAKPLKRFADFFKNNQRMLQGWGDAFRFYAGRGAQWFADRLETIQRILSSNTSKLEQIGELSERMGRGMANLIMGAIAGALGLDEQNENKFFQAGRTAASRFVEGFLDQIANEAFWGKVALWFAERAPVVGSITGKNPSLIGQLAVGAFGVVILRFLLRMFRPLVTLVSVIEGMITVFKGGAEVFSRIFGWFGRIFGGGGGAGRAMGGLLGGAGRFFGPVGRLLGPVGRFLLTRVGGPLAMLLRLIGLGPGIGSIAGGIGGFLGGAAQKVGGFLGRIQPGAWLADRFSKIGGFFGNLQSMFLRFSQLFDVFTRFFVGAGEFLSKVGGFFTRASETLARIANFFAGAGGPFTHLSRFFERGSVFLVKLAGFFERGGSFLTQAGSFLARSAEFLARISGIFGRFGGFFARIGGLFAGGLLAGGLFGRFFSKIGGFFGGIFGGLSRWVGKVGVAGVAGRFLTRFLGVIGLILLVNDILEILEETLGFDREKLRQQLLAIQTWGLVGDEETRAMIQEIYKTAKSILISILDALIELDLSVLWLRDFPRRLGESIVKHLFGPDKDAINRENLSAARRNAGSFFDLLEEIGVDVGAIKSTRARSGSAYTSGGTARISPQGYVFPVQGYTGDVNPHHGSHPGAADLFAALGTPVRAMRGGTVVDAGYNELGGHSVTIRGDDNLLYYYAHLLEAAAVKAGDVVTAGQLIGKVGASGNAAQVQHAPGQGHLHLGIGRAILTGAGPAGGAGADFDAVSLLRSTLHSTGGPAGNIDRSKPLREWIAQQAQAMGISPAVALRMFQQESGFNQGAVSSAGAFGVAQLMPETAAALARQMGVSVEELRRDPYLNALAGMLYLREQLDRFNNNYTLAVAAYNAGPGRVIEAGYQVPNIPETQRYVQIVLGNGLIDQPRRFGGPILEPVVGFGLKTGQSYSFAESGPEYVVPGGRAGASVTIQPGAIQITVQGASNPDDVADELVEALAQNLASRLELVFHNLP